jgi:hypothetical protein
MPSPNRTKLTAGLRAAVAQHGSDTPYDVLVRLEDGADQSKAAKWCGLDAPSRSRSLTVTLGLDELADLSRQPWVKVISLSEELYSLGH